MWKGDKYCPDCKGKELEISMSYTPVTTEYGELRTVSFVVDDVEDTSCSTDITPVMHVLVSKQRLNEYEVFEIRNTNAR
jgi:hypothetical protein